MSIHAFGGSHSSSNDEGNLVDVVFLGSLGLATGGACFLQASGGVGVAATVGYVLLGGAGVFLGGSLAVVVVGGILYGLYKCGEGLYQLVRDLQLQAVEQEDVQVEQDGLLQALVAGNQHLQRTNQQLQQDNQQLRTEMQELRTMMQELREELVSR